MKKVTMTIFLALMLVGMIFVTNRGVVVYLLYVSNKTVGNDVVYVNENELKLPDLWWVMSHEGDLFVLGRIIDSNSGYDNVIVYVEKMSADKQNSRINAAITDVGDNNVTKLSSVSLVDQQGRRIVRDEYMVVTPGEDYGNRFVIYYYIDLGVVVTAVNIKEEYVNKVSEIVTGLGKVRSSGSPGAGVRGSPGSE